MDHHGYQDKVNVGEKKTMKNEKAEQGRGKNLMRQKLGDPMNFCSYHS